MAIIALPSAAGIKRVAWDLDQPAQVNRSDWTKSRQVVTGPGRSMWSGTADLVVKRGEAAMLDVEAFLVDLEGQVNKFRLRIVENPQLPGAHSVVVDGAGQSGRALGVRGGVAGETLLRGHKVTVDDQCVVLMESATFGIDGKTTLHFKPSLRLSPADGDAVEVVWPTAIVALTASSVGWSVDPGQQYQSKQLAFEEAF